MPIRTKMGQARCFALEPIRTTIPVARKVMPMILTTTRCEGEPWLR
jgi:hypothetical protein